MYKSIQYSSLAKLIPIAIMGMLAWLPFFDLKAQIAIDTVLFNPCFPIGTTTIPVTTNASGGTSSLYQVSTDNGANYSTFGVYTFNLNVGTSYNIITRDSSNALSDTVVINIPTALNATINLLFNFNGAAISCFKASDGSAQAVAAGGTSSYTYLWNSFPPQNTALVTGLGEGTYIVSITDANGCTAHDTVSIAEPAPILLSSTVTPVTCNGAANGTATVAGIGGTGTLGYLWNTTPPQTTATATGLAPGVYEVTATDANGCGKIENVTITEPSAVSVSANASSNPTCNGASNGTANGNIIGGNAPYTFLWTGGQTTQNATGLTAGIYSLSASDANGCSSTASVTLTEPSALTVTATVGQNASCSGSNDGSATVTATGGSGSGYTFVWNSVPTQNTATATGLSAGIYTVTATDINGCNQTSSVTITEPSAITSTAAVISNYNGTQISCNGASDGTAQATASGGTGTLTYLWNTIPAQSTQNASGLSAGVYTVTTTDFNGCNTTSSVTLTEPSAITATTSITATIDCFGNSTGSLQANANGGLGAPYTFAWSSIPIQNTATATGLAAGVYTVTTTDINGCNQTSSITLTEPSAITLTTAVTSNYNGAQISCNGASDGMALATPTGGTAGYTYLWNTTPAQSTATATGLTAGTYQVTITDAGGCTATNSITVSEPAVVAVTAAMTSPVICAGTSTGTAQATPTGGTTPYTFVWNSAPTQNTATATGLSAGVYTVTATDINGCNQTSSITITEPSAITSTAAVISNYNGAQISCNGASDGMAEVIASGGTGTLTYFWSSIPIQNTATATGLAAGVYTVTTTDSNGCNTISSVTLTEPSAITATTSVTATIDCFGNSTGSLQANANGGLGAPYTFAWSSIPIQNTATATGLAAGVYTVTVTDANNCPQTSTITLTEPSAITLTTAVTSNYNGAQISCNGASDGTTLATPTGGTAGYTYLWNTTPAQSTATATGLTAGTYQVTVTDANGCSTTETQIVTEPTVLTATSNTTDAFCSNLNGTASSIPNGGVAPYSYIWSTGGVTATINQLDAGIYTVTITDINGCTFDVVDTVAASSYIINLSGLVDSSNCYAPNSGSIELAVQNAVYPLSFAWSNGDSDSIINNLPDGIFYVTVSDVNGCSSVDSFVVFSPEDTIAINLSSPIYPNGFNTTKTDAADGSIYATIDGGVLPYTLIWSNGATEEDLTNLQANVYTITVTDVNGCSKSVSIELTEPKPEPPAMPEGISPDGDNLNDAFVILNIEYYPENVFVVYNRWGNEVNRYEHYANEWTGLNKGGEELPAGTYFVVLQLTDRNEVYKGYVEIRRR